MNGIVKKLSARLKAIIALSACAFLAFFAGISATGVKADAADELTIGDYAASFVMNEGASVRMSTENGGIRFTSYISEKDYNELNARFAGFTVGTLIAPKDLIAGKGDFTLENTEITAGKDYLNVTGEFVKSASAEGVYCFNAVISNLKTANYDRTFIASSYIKFGDDIVYAADFNEEGRSAFYVASAAKALGGASGEQVEGYLKSVSSYEGTTLVAENLTVRVGETVSLPAYIEGTNGGRARKTEVYANVSSASENVSVSGSNITGVKAGSAVITLTYGELFATVTVTVEAARVLSNGTYLSYEDTGADFNLNIPNGETPRILQLTDTQILNPESAAAERLNASERGRYRDFELNVFAHMDKVVEEAKPHLIILTGDNIYGEFDEDYSMVEALIARLDSYGIYWGFTYGNHDRESLVSELTARYSSSEYCLYANASEGAEQYYSIAVLQGGEVIRALYLMDTNSTASSVVKDDIVKVPGMTAAQVNWFERTSAEVIEKSGNANLPASVFTHIASTQFYEAAKKYGFPETVDFEANKDGDFGNNHGAMLESPWTLKRDVRWFDIAKAANTDTIFVGHQHVNNTSITYDGVRLTFGLKTGMYDEYQKGELGGTLLTLNGSEATVNHIYSCDRETETFDYFVKATDREMWGARVNADATSEFVLTRTTDENEIPENATGAALKAVRTYAGDGAGVYNYVRFITFKSVTAGRSYKIYFDLKTDTAGVYTIQYRNDENATKSVGTFSAEAGSNVVRMIFNPTEDIKNLQLLVTNGATTNDYYMIFDNFSVSEIVIPDRETFDDMYIAGGMGYGLNMKVRDYSINMSIALTDKAEELPEGGSGKALKFTNSGADNRYNFVAITTNKAVTAGHKYLISFDIKTLSGTYNSIMQIYQSGSAAKTYSGLKQGKVELIYEPTADCSNIELYFTDGATANAYTVTLDNIYITELKTSAITPFDKEDYESAIIADNTVFGVMETVFAKANTAGWSMAKFALSISENEAYRPINSTGKYLLAEVQSSSGHNLTWINFNFGAVEAGKTYTFSFNGREIGETGNLGSLHYALTTTQDPANGNSAAIGTTYSFASLENFSQTITFTETYDHVSLWLQLGTAGATDHVFLAFDNVKMTETEA